ncbi:uncharacterized protein [Cicer arietinum]|uniref:RING-type E3 ubiquitin transferase n=1 Tax=Cicer arietinum TaxID=3827 RepID=A0A1S2XBZ2_CICAR|nr:RING-H2 finger protein ATL52 [Cicer arietinum]
MKLHHRKLVVPEICEWICQGKNSLSNCSSNKDCSVCFKICLTKPQLSYPYSPPPPPPQVPSSFYSLDENQNHHKIITYFILTLSLLSFIFFLVCCRFIYIKLRSKRSLRLQPSSSSSTTTTQQVDVNNLDDEEQYGSMLDHPIWYIRTIGLHQSVVNAISVCKYKKGEGLIEGTECSVCLSEFEENENLRLLPKCHHAFHLPCIDTWLSSHTNCPMCRAPIVTNPTTTRVESLESSIVVDSSSLGQTQMENFEENSNEGFESSVFDSQLRNRIQEDGEGQLGGCENERQVHDAVTVRPRRSVSMDDSFVANVLSIESNVDSSRKVNGIDNLATTSKGSSSFSIRSTRYLKGVSSPMKRSSSYNGKYLLSWYSRSKKKPNAILRSS